jgi:hypothetical protein
MVVPIEAAANVVAAPTGELSYGLNIRLLYIVEKGY